ncbi:MAG TPA: hypothetical protein PLX89_01330 [Verrucomicrobiota bacterium]|nr:hypothetical protein [Verrucomicrobiota bacterium]
MNRTLLLIMCDFLLLNLLALTRWDRSEPQVQRPRELVIAGKTNTVRDDLVAALREALVDEQAQREVLSRKIASELAARESSVAQSEEKRRQLEATLAQTRQSATQLGEQLTAQTRQVTQTRELLDQTQTHLTETARDREALAESVRTSEAERRKLQEELERQREQTASLAAARAEAEQKVASLNSAVKVAEAEKQLLRENLTDLKGQVSQAQEEKAKLQEQTSVLAQGVTQLAKNSDEFKQEIRENTPINANLLYAEFLTNRVNVAMSGIGAGVFGSTTREKETATIFVTDGPYTMALIHVNEAPFSLSIPGFGLDNLTTRVSRNGQAIPAGRPFLTSSDPRIIAIPVDSARVQELGLKTYPLAKTPFKFPEAVLLSRGGRYYGEVEFKLDPRTPEFVRMKTRLMSRVFGEFSPSAGDLVLSKTGELLGVMVNDEYCAVLKRLQPAPGGVLEAGLSREQMGRMLEGFRARVNSLPAPLQ